MSKHIEIKGARLHNLKNINLEIPRGEFVVITGPSGSGKSSLAFDTIYAEGQRRYVESLSAYARQFLEKMPKPEIESISGLQPAIAIQQKAPSGNPRSTVGTVTEIYDYLRLLFARIGDIHCHNCGQPVKKEQPEDVLNEIRELNVKTKFFLAFPLPEEFQQTPETTKEIILSRGFIRVWQNDQLIDLRKRNPINVRDSLYVVVDRGIQHDRMDRLRLLDSIETAFHEGEGTACLISESGKIRHFHQNFICSHCGTGLLEPQPRLFSFNNPFGACPGCQGFGDMMDLDLDKVIPDATKSIREDTIVPWRSASYRHMISKLARIAPRYHISFDTPFKDLSKEQQDIIINGNKDFIGIKGFFKKLEKKKYKVHVRVFISRFRSYFTCTLCNGKRLRPEALAVTINSKTISDLVQMKIGEIGYFFSHLSPGKERAQIAQQLLKEVNRRIQYLMEVGLSYLHLDRRANTLSGGEFQRINLATALGTSLTGTLFVLDEPTIGLHARDTGRLIKILQSLAGMGNTTLVVEHDRSVIEHAGHIIDMGPAAGEKGGEVIFSGKFNQFLRDANSLTASYLRNERHIPPKTVFRKGNGYTLTVVKARAHNLKGIQVRIPLGMLVAITGVSGSGKSTLVNDVLYQGYLATRGQADSKPGAHDEIRGLKNIFRMEMINQAPIGRTPRSNPVTYIKGFDEIRKLFAQTPRARAAGYSPGYFSFNVRGGRCENCQGDGQIKIEMQFLADVYLECDVCHGRRYQPEILNVYFRGKNIYDVLETTIDEAILFFKDHPAIVKKISVLQEVGLGYLKLGQPATTLSGGEAQRVKLAAHLSRKTQRDVLFILDEPTTGLHFDDIKKLLTALDALMNRGASVLIIEHNLDVIGYADWIIDLGPEGGDAGGYVVAEGTPPQIIQNSHSYTGHFLKKYEPFLMSQPE